MAAPQPVPGNIVLTGYLDLPEDRADSILAALDTHIELTRAEYGCVYFSVTLDEHQENRLNVSEIFADRAAFDAHQARAGATDWAQITAGIERHYEIIDIV